MRKTIRKTTMASAFALAFGLSALAAADNHTGNFDVTATVEGACSLTADNNLEFGNYNPVSGAAVEGTTTISVTCSNGMANTEVGLDYSGNMSDDTNDLAYGLFTDAGHVTSWGNAETDRQAVEATGTAQTMTVYGQITADQNEVPVGSYSETVTATVYW